MKMRFVSMWDTEKVELYMLKEFKPEPGDYNVHDEWQNLQSIRSSDIIGQVVYQDERYTVVHASSYYIATNDQVNGKLKIGDIVLLDKQEYLDDDRSAEYSVVLIDKGASDYVIKHDLGNTVKGFENFDHLTYAMIKKAHDDEIAKDIQEKEHTELMHKMREAEQEQADKDWKERGIGERGGAKINGNTYTCRSCSITIDKQFNALYDEVRKIKSCDSDGMFVTELIRRGCVDITYQYIGHMAESPKLVIHVEDHKSTVNGIKVRKDKIPTIVRHIRKPEDDIATLNSLGVTKLGALDINKIEVGKIKIPIELHCVNPDLFRLSINDMQADIPWTDITHYFNITACRQSGSMDLGRFKELMTNHFKLDMEHVFELLREFKLVGEI